MRALFLITGLVSFAVTAPAIVKASSLMPIKVIKPDIVWPEMMVCIPHRMYGLGQGILYYTEAGLEWRPVSEEEFYA